MRALKKLFDHVGRTWEREPKEMPVLHVKRGTGPHTRLTIDKNALHLHTQKYNAQLPSKQTVELDDMTIADLVSVLRLMDYDVEVVTDSPQLLDKASFTLMQMTDVQLPVELKVFRSPSWTILYPIARLLEEVNFDTEKAIAQLYLSSARSKWLDYWGTFFGVRRNLGEPDSLLRKRIFLEFANIKSNDIAIEELVRYIIEDNFEIVDYGPAVFELTTHPKHMPVGGLLQATLDSVRAGGVTYMLNFELSETEDYYAEWIDRAGGLRNIDVVMLMELGMYYTEAMHGYESELLGEAVLPVGAELYPLVYSGTNSTGRRVKSFMLNKDKLNSRDSLLCTTIFTNDILDSSTVIHLAEAINTPGEGGRMFMVEGNTVVKELTL